MHELLAFLASRAATNDGRGDERPFPKDTLRQLAGTGSFDTADESDKDDRAEAPERRSPRRGVFRRRSAAGDDG